MQSCCCGDQLVPSTYTEGRELILFIQDVFNGFAHAADDPINHVHNAIRGHLVSVDDPGTVHGHDLSQRGKISVVTWNQFGKWKYYFF